ncbi:Telomerase reverse transcriptase, partial [Coemansia sp. RSA 2610]
PNESLGSAPMDTDSDSELDTGAAATPELCPAVDPPNYLEMASSHKDVYMFVQRCVCGVVPRDLIGGRHNHRRLYTLLRTLVSSGRFEAPNLHEAMQRFRLSEASSWLDCHDPAAMDVYAGVIHWILSEFVIRIIGSYFYATESSNGRHRLFFFRKDVWQSISRDAWRELEASGMYAPRSYAEAAATTNNDSANNGAARQNFGLSRIRLLPKERGFRAIVNMRHSFAIKCLNPARPGNDTRAFTRVHVTPTNKQLADVLAALRPWHVAHPELFGSATFGPADLHAKIKQFKTTLQAQPAFGSQRLYMAKLDIHHAYDSIPQARLLELLHKHLPDEEIMVQKFWTLTPSFSRFRPSFLRHGQPSNEFTAFGDLARDLSARRKGLIFGDLCSTSYFHGRAVYNAIAEHIQQNTVITRSGLLRQQRGIPQGSVLSSLLCNFFYGQLEQQHLLPLVNVQSTLMMRVVDDFLIISTDRDQVTAVIERMSRGVSDYGCRLNAAKTLVNFELVRGGQRVPQAESSDFPWCGILINDRTLDVAADYSRLAPPIRLEETVTINVGREAGVALRQKMLAAVRLKMHPLYTDSQLNSRQTVLLNLYQNFVLCAKKFHLICRRLPMRTGNHRYLISVIEDTIALAHILLKCSCRKASIAAQDVKWLGTHAFHRVLARKQARYPLLLACLARALRHPDAIKLAQTHASVVGSPSNGTVLAIGY